MANRNVSLTFVDCEKELCLSPYITLDDLYRSFPLLRRRRSFEKRYKIPHQTFVVHTTTRNRCFELIQHYILIQKYGKPTDYELLPYLANLDCLMDFIGFLDLNGVWPDALLATLNCDLFKYDDPAWEQMGPLWFTKIISRSGDRSSQKIVMQWIAKMMRASSPTYVRRNYSEVINRCTLASDTNLGHAKLLDYSGLGWNSEYMHLHDESVKKLVVEARLELPQSESETSVCDFVNWIKSMPALQAVHFTNKASLMSSKIISKIVSSGRGHIDCITSPDYIPWVQWESHSAFPERFKREEIFLSYRDNHIDTPDWDAFRVFPRGTPKLKYIVFGICEGKIHPFSFKEDHIDLTEYEETYWLNDDE